MIVKPYSEIAAEAFNAADFPALKHFWHCKQPGAILSDNILDIVGGAHIEAAVGAGGVVGNGLNAGGTTYTPSATLTPPGTASCLLIACAAWGITTSGFVYGSTSATGGMNTGNASAGAKLFDGTTTKTTTGTQTASDDFTRWATVRSVSGVPTELMMGETDASTLDVYTNVIDLTAATAITDVPAVAQSIGMPTAGITLYGAAFFKFAGALPPKEVIQAMAAWCDYQWRNNANICMYPGFKGLA